MADRHGAVHRQPRAPGDAADRRPQGDARAGALGPRPGRQRPVLAVRRLLRHRPAPARAGHREGQVAAQGRPARTASRSTCTRPTAPPAWSTRPTSSPQQAKAAGVTVNVKNDPNYYGDQYLKLPFSVDFWGTRNYLPQVANGSIPHGAVQRVATGRPSRARIGLRRPLQPGAGRARRAKRTDIIHEMQNEEYNDGRLHHPVLQQPGRRLLSSRCRVRGEPRHPQPRHVRPWLPDHLVRLVDLTRAGGAGDADARPRRHGGTRRHLGFIVRRMLLGLLVLFLVSLIVFAATQALPAIRPAPSSAARPRPTAWPRCASS